MKSGKEKYEKPLNKATLVRIWPYLRAYKGLIFLAFLALSVAAGTVLGIGASLRYLVDYGLSRENENILDFALIGLLAIIFVLSCASFFRSYLVSIIGEKLIATIRKEVYSNLIRLDPGFYEMTNTGELISRVTADTTVLQSTLASTLPMALRNMILVIGGVIMLFVASPKLSVMFIIFVPIILIPILYFARKVREYSRISQEEVSKLGSHIDETLHGVQVVQSFAQENRMNSRFGDLTDHAFKAATKYIKVRAAMSALVIFIVFSSIGTILWIGGHDVIDGDMSPGALTSFVFYAVLAASATGTLSEVYGSLNRAAGAAERLFDLIEETPDLKNSDNKTISKEHTQGAITFDEVNFEYKSFPGKVIVKDLSLNIKPGETVAFVGPSGAGKTTLFKLLLRFYDPISGSIEIDENSITDYSLDDYRRLFGVVPQDPVLFSDTVRNNIMFALDNADEEYLHHLARLSNAESFINNLSDGYETLIGERGTRLSGGQRQRIAIARALAHDPKILLFDEATSSLDSNSEQAIQSALQEIRKDRTTLIIAHRLSTVLIADRICVMKDGKIIACGTHEALLKDSKLYAEMVGNQMLIPEEKVA